MTRKALMPWFVLALSSAPMLTGCSVKVGSQEPAQTPPPPPPPPPPPATAAPAPPPAPAPAPEPVKKSTVAVKDGRLGIPGAIVYETGKAIIKPESEPTLNALKEFLTQNKNYSLVRIEGHTDNVGKPEDNLKLSQDRSLAVVQWLADHGETKDRFLAVGFGETRPIADNKTEEGRAQNRRTEFHLAEVDHKAFLHRDRTGGGTAAPGQKPVLPPNQ